MLESGRDQTDMSKLRILHSADLHLDSPFEGLSAGKAAIRRGEQRELLSALASWPGGSRRTSSCSPVTCWTVTIHITRPGKN